MYRNQNGFESSKQCILEKLRNCIDKSPKGSLDEPIEHLVQMMNAQEDYVTTSSCSGRIALFRSDVIQSGYDVNNSDQSAKGGKWLLIEHATITLEQLNKALQLTRGDSGNLVIFKHEPFIMHIQCRTLEAAKNLLQQSLACGFRESGIVLGKKIMVAIRTTANLLELPIAKGEDLLLSNEYLEFLVSVANKKFIENRRRTDRLAASLEHYFLSMSTDTMPSDATCKNTDGEPCTTLDFIQVIDTPLELMRRGHSCINVDGKLFVFGGYGGQNTKLNTLTVVQLKETKDGNASFLQFPHESTSLPSPRLYHSATLLHKEMFVFGGRGSPAVPYNDIYALHTTTLQWRRIEPQGNLPPPRWGHTATFVQSRDIMLVYGGRDAEHVWNDIFVLNSPLSNPWWSVLETTKESPYLFSHSTNLMDDKQLIVYGGHHTIQGDDCSNECHILDLGELLMRFSCFTSKSPSVGLDKQEWSTPLLHGTSKPVASHQAVLIFNQFLVILGGMSGTTLNDVAMLDLQKMKWGNLGKHLGEHTATLVGEQLGKHLVEHTATLVGETQDQVAQIVIIGGGAQCFGFGLHSCPSYWLKFPFQQYEKPLSNVIVNKKKKKKMSVSGLNQQQVSTLVMVVGKSLVRQVKVALEKLNVYDKSRKIASCGMGIDDHEEEMFEIPVLKDAQEVVLDNKKHQQYPEEIEKEWLGKFIFRKSTIKCESVGVARSRNLPFLIQEALKKLLEEEEHGDGVEQWMQNVPKKYEWVGDILMIPNDSFVEDVWQPHLQKVWEIIASTFQAKRLARKSFVDSGPKRQSRVQLLYCVPQFQSQDGWTEIKEYGIKYTFDITKVMFCSGNVTEKARMAKIDCKDETIVDLYAGIGYYVLPFLVHGQAKLVHALEWNLDSIEALQKNLRLNHVQDRCIIHHGDNRITGVQLGPIADRINLGLLPSSQDGWSVAVKLMKATGGWMHVHGNVPTLERQKWGNDVAMSIKLLFKECGREFHTTCKHVERVKSYAPKIDHLVADIHCTPIQ